MSWWSAWFSKKQQKSQWTTSAFFALGIFNENNFFFCLHKRDLIPAVVNFEYNYQHRLQSIDFQLTIWWWIISKMASRQRKSQCTTRPEFNIIKNQPQHWKQRNINEVVHYNFDVNEQIKIASILKFQTTKIRL